MGIDVDDWNGCACLKVDTVEIGEVVVKGTQGTKRPGDVVWSIGMRAKMETMRLVEPFLLGGLPEVFAQLKDGFW